jgi:hypothetical protein
MSLIMAIPVSILCLTGFADSEVNVILDETFSDDPLPVVLSSFSASITTENSVVLEWITETESNMLGYNVYRNEEFDLNSAFQVNNLMISAHNSTETIVYFFADDTVESGISYFYWLQMNELDLSNTFHGPVSVTVEEQGEDDISTIEFSTTLKGAYPNPFNPSTTIAFSLAEKGQVTIAVFNLQGQLLQILAIDRPFDKGSHTISWNGKDKAGQPVSSGIYFYRMQTDDGYEETKKMTILK